MERTKLTAIAAATMLVLTAFASVPVTAQETAVAVETGDATDLTDTEATLGGELTDLPDGENATVWFEYWQEGDPTNNSTTADAELAEPGTFSADVDSLANNTTYVFVAHVEANGTHVTGEQATFTTLDRFAPLGVETLEATDVTNTSATLNGELTGLDGEAEAEVRFEYWQEGDSANKTGPVGVGTLDAPGSFNHAVTGLENDTGYVYRTVAEANGTTVYGENVSFTTGDAAEPTWDGEGPFGQWVKKVLQILGVDTNTPFGQQLSELVVKNNPGSEHRSDKANPGGNGNGPPEHAGNGSDGEQGPPDHAGKDDDDERGPPEHAKGNNDGAGDGGELNVTVTGDIEAGANITVTVMAGGDPVENATVSVEGEVVGTTDSDGQLEVTLPDDIGDEVEISAATDDAEGEWEYEVEEDDA